MAFKKPPIGKRGYDEEDVDAFLDEVEQELVRLLMENSTLRDQAQRGGPSAPGGPGATGSNPMIRSELAGLTAQLEWMHAARARADEHARSLRSQLEQARGETTGGAGGGGRLSQVVAMAQRTADDYVRDAEHTAEELLADSRAEAEQIAEDAERWAASTQRDAQRDHTDAINRVETERASLLEEIERLGELAHSYQAALRTHVTQQLNDLKSVTTLD